MKRSESFAFAELLFAYKHLWIEYATLKYRHENPDGNVEEARNHNQELAEDVFLPVSGALLAGTPFQDVLRAALQNLSQR
jgi:hypothetical protein